MGLIEALAEGPVALDTCVLIYYVEEHPTYARLLAPLFAAVDEGARTAVCSELALAEVLVAPYRKRRRDLAMAYEQHLTRGRGLRLLPIDRSVLRGAAWLRATATVKTPDAIHLATAMAAKAGTFVTNDREFPRPLGLRILQLRDLEERGTEH